MLFVAVCDVQAQRGVDVRPHPNPTGPNIPMVINLNSQPYDDGTDEDATDLLAHCSILPRNFTVMKRALAAGGNAVLYDPLTDQGPSYAEYYVAEGKNQGTATNVFRTACTVNHGRLS